MQITLEIPEDFAAKIAAGKDPARVALEIIAVEGYRTNRLNESQVRRMLSFETRMEVHQLLAEHNVCLHYTRELLDLDIAASDAFLALRQTAAAQTR